MSASVYLTSRPYSQFVSHQWLTSVLKAINGWEQRAALYTWPRVSLQGEYQVFSRSELAWIRRKLFKYQDALWGIPIWPDLTTVSSEAASGQTTINVGDTTNRHFYAGRDLILISPSAYGTYEVKTITTVNATSLVCSSNLSSTWAAGSFVLPVYDCRISEENIIQKRSKQRDSFLIQGMEAYESARSFTYTLPSSGASTYLTYDVFDYIPRQASKHTYTKPYDLIQYLGIGVKDTDYSRSEIEFEFTFVREKRASIWDILDFFDSKRGRYNKFWVPSWNRDIVVSTGFASTDYSIEIENIEYRTHWLPEDVIGRYVHIRFPDGTTTQKKITDASSSSPYTITFDEAIGTTVTIADINSVFISFLMLARFGTDKLDLKYSEGAHSATIDIPFVALVEEDV